MYSATTAKFLDLFRQIVSRISATFVVPDFLLELELLEDVIVIVDAAVVGVVIVKFSFTKERDHKSMVRNRTVHGLCRNLVRRQ